MSKVEEERSVKKASMRKEEEMPKPTKSNVVTDGNQLTFYEVFVKGELKVYARSE